MIVILFNRSQKLLKGKTKNRISKYSTIYIPHSTAPSKTRLHSFTHIKRALIGTFIFALAIVCFINVFSIYQMNQKLSIQLTALESANSLQAELLQKKHGDIVALIEDLQEYRDVETQYESKYNRMLASYVNNAMGSISVSRSGNQNESSTRTSSFINEVKDLKELLQFLTNETDDDAVLAVSSSTLPSSSDPQEVNELALLKAELEEYILRLPTDWPVIADISSEFGYRLHPVYKRTIFHEGLDLAADRNTPITASASGKIIQSGWEGGFGYCITVDHGNSFTTKYAHCSTLLGKVGDTVEKGQVIAKVGSTGTSTGPHLHFEVRINGQHVDPLIYLIPLE